jgi:hypothetical protein
MGNQISLVGTLLQMVISPLDQHILSCMANIIAFQQTKRSFNIFGLGKAQIDTNLSYGK